MVAVEDYLKPAWSSDMPWADEIIIAIENKLQTYKSLLAAAGVQIEALQKDCVDLQAQIKEAEATKKFVLSEYNELKKSKEGG